MITRNCLNGTRPERGNCGAAVKPDAMLRGLERARTGGQLELAARTFAALFLALLAAGNFYRAATQSITADEAFTYNHFAGGDEPVRVYDANHHVLFSWLARASVGVFGLSELTLRLPSVLAGCAYLAGVFHLSRYLFRRVWLFLLAVTSLSLNPFILDFLSAARGYGLALALYLWACDELAQALGAATLPLKRVYLASACLALAVAANLNFAIPGAALAGVFCLLACRQHPPVRARLLWLAGRFLTPGLVLAVAILAWPLRTATLSSFYVGVDSLRQTLEGLIFYSFCHARPAAPSWLQNRLWDVSHWFVPAALALSGVVTLWLLLRRGAGKPERLETFLMMIGGSSLGTLALLVAARHLAGLKYPVDRTAIYWIPLFSLLCLSLVGILLRAPGIWPAAGLAPAAFLLVAVVQYGLQFNVRYYAQWRYDAGTKRIAEVIRACQAAHPKARARVGATWLFEPSLNFYRQRYRMNWLERVTRQGPQGAFDYYVLEGADRKLVEQLKLEVLYRDPLSEVVLARPRGVLQSRP